MYGYPSTTTSTPAAAVPFCSSTAHPENRIEAPDTCTGCFVRGPSTEPSDSSAYRASPGVRVNSALLPCAELCVPLAAFGSWGTGEQDVSNRSTVGNESNRIFFCIVDNSDCHLSGKQKSDCSEDRTAWQLVLRSFHQRVRILGDPFLKQSAISLPSTRLNAFIPSILRCSLSNQRSVLWINLSSRA